MTQTRLFPDPRPLVDRLGCEFFRRLPQSPGVYLMRGDCGTILYVGKAKNLRKRLNSYRVANPQRMARRTLRLLHRVKEISWEECSDELQAIRRESELLRTLKPQFNRAGVWQGPSRFLTWRCCSGTLEFTVREAPVSKYHCAGPFGMQAIYLRQALVRLLWCALQPARGLLGMPFGWIDGRLPTIATIHSEDGSPSLVAEATQRLSELSRGGQEEFQKWYSTRVLPPMHSCERSIMESDMEHVVEWFARSNQSLHVNDIEPSAKFETDLFKAAHRNEIESGMEANAGLVLCIDGCDDSAQT